MPSEVQGILVTTLQLTSIALILLYGSISLIVLMRRESHGYKTIVLVLCLVQGIKFLTEWLTWPAVADQAGPSWRKSPSLLQEGLALLYSYLSFVFYGVVTVWFGRMYYLFSHDDRVVKRRLYPVFAVCLVLALVACIPPLLFGNTHPWPVRVEWWDVGFRALYCDGLAMSFVAIMLLAGLFYIRSVAFMSTLLFDPLTHSIVRRARWMAGVLLLIYFFCVSCLTIAMLDTPTPLPAVYWHGGVSIIDTVKIVVVDCLPVAAVVFTFAPPNNQLGKVFLTPFRRPGSSDAIRKTSNSSVGSQGRGSPIRIASALDGETAPIAVSMPKSYSVVGGRTYHVSNSF